MTPFLDIFSKTNKKKLPKKEKIIIDYQERNSLVSGELEKLGLKTEFTRLKVADYMVKGIAIERKTVSDFISSMINKRLIKQLKELQQYENRLLLIEGIEEQELYSEEFAKTKTGIHPNAIRGFLLSILLNYKTPILFTKDFADTARFIKILSKKQKKELPLNINKKTLNTQERIQFILEGFPGIGPKTARKLLNEFKTLQNIINASEEELKEVVGKKSEPLIKIINYKYKEKPRNPEKK